jgi:hypothetical protein
MRHHLDDASGATIDGTVAGRNRFALTAEKIIDHTQVLGCQGMGAVKAERAFEPRQGLGGSARPL